MLKASTIADKYGVEVSTVYQIKSVMKKEGLLGAPAPAEKANEVKELSDEEEADGLPEELAPEEQESEDEDTDEDDYDPLAYRGKVAGSEI